MRRQWMVQRSERADKDGRHRWDRAYQQLLAWTQPEQKEAHQLMALRPPPEREVNHESGHLRQSLHPAPSPGAEH
jgi:ribosomal protein S10